MSADSIPQRLAALREAGAELRAQPARRALEALGRVLDAWSDPTSTWRRGLEAQLPEATGFTPPVVREGLARGLSRWTGPALEALVERELAGSPEPRGYDATACVLAGSIPMPTLVSLLAPLVLRSPVLAKTAARDPLTAGWLSASLADADPLLGRCLDVVSFPGSDASAMGELLAADCVVATGSDEVVEQVAARVAPPRRLVAYGHRLSVAAVTGRALGGSARTRVARRLALDVALWDQLGCLSPVAVYALGPGAAVDALAEALAEALQELEQRLPRGRMETAAAAAVAHERADAELRAAAGRAVALHASAGSAWTVVREDSAAPRPAPLHRFLRVLPVADEDELLSALAPLGRHLAGVALAGFGDRSARLGRALAQRGATRICPAGELQSPPLDWPRDSRGVLRPLLRPCPGKSPGERAS